jgi:NDP-sugar pyrophosphorylase family protein
MIQIIIPAAGRGSRFQNSEYTNPKPLIEWNGKNMIEHVVDNFKSQEVKIFLLCRDHHKIHIDGCQVKNIDYTTEGPAISASLFREDVDPEEELIITNCDQIIKDWDLKRFISFSRRYDGVLGCFISSKNHNSYVKVDDFNQVIEVKEKEVISNIATNGLHYWRKAKYFFDSLDEMVKQNDTTNGEYYVAPTYNYLLKTGHSIGIFMFNQHFPIGTPEQLNYFLQNENN